MPVFTKKGVVYAVEWDSVDRGSEVRVCKWSDKMAELRKGEWVVEVVNMWGAVLSASMRENANFVANGVIGWRGDNEPAH